MASANDKVTLALIGAGGRGTSIILGMQQCCENVEVKYICDVDNQRGGSVIEELGKQQGFKPIKVNNMKTVFDDKDVDAVVIATPEHWHALASVWACEAGKDVYVEKNICLTTAEGQKMVEAAKRYKRIVQCGTQNRSADYATCARDYIAEGKLGNIVTVKTYCMLPGSREWFLKPDSAIPEGLDWNEWLGPANEIAYNVSRHKAWYDWWAYSGGISMSGDASHVVDLARMALGDPLHPRSVYCAGGRVIYDDKREIPDNQTVTFDYGDYVMTLESSQYGDYLSKTPDEVRYSDKFPAWNTNSTRIEIYGTLGMMYLGRHGGGWQVFGEDNALLAEKSGYFPDEKHQQNFIDSIRSRKQPNAPVKQGHLSAALVNYANLSYRCGRKQLIIDPETEKITNSDIANELDSRIYREGYMFKA